MIIVTTPMQQDQVITLLTEGKEFTFVEKKGIKLYFKPSTDANEEMVNAVKRQIKATTWGSVLYFQVNIG